MQEAPAPAQAAQAAAQPAAQPAAARTTPKSTWTPEEDRQLSDIVRTHGAKNWSLIANFIDGRTGKQCRERYKNHLDPALRKGPFTAEEDALIVSMVEKLGPKWAVIAHKMVGRTDNAIKNRYNSSLRRAHEEGRYLLETDQATGRPTLVVTKRTLHEPKPAAAMAAAAALSALSSSSSLPKPAAAASALPSTTPLASGAAAQCIPPTPPDSPKADQLAVEPAHAHDPAHAHKRKRSIQVDTVAEWENHLANSLGQAAKGATKRRRVAKKIDFASGRSSSSSSPAPLAELETSAAMALCQLRFL